MIDDEAKFWMRRRDLLRAAIGAAGLALGAGRAKAVGKIRIALVVKALGIRFFEAARRGGEEAARELGDVELIYTGPATTTGEGQIETVNALIAQRVSAIAISANDPNALVPILKKAMQRGIAVLSWDGPVPAAGREAHLAPSSAALIGETLAKLAAAPIGGEGEIAILSTTRTAPNQNSWIAAMKEAMRVQPGLQVIGTAYGEDLAYKSYREALALMQVHPGTKVILAPTAAGIVAAAQAVEDQRRVGQVFVTGLGLPSELAGHVAKGSVRSFAMWDPVDLGYAAVCMADAIVSGSAKPDPGASLPLGRLGSRTLDDAGEAVLGPPTIYDKTNVDQAAKLF